MTTVLSGKLPAKILRTQLQEKISYLKTQHVIPTLVTIVIGDNAASRGYIRSEQRQARQIGLKHKVLQLPPQISEKQAQQTILQISQLPDVDAILLAAPLPPHLCRQKIMQVIPPLKDIEGLTAENIGRLWTGQPTNIPATALGIMKLLDFYQISVSGQHVVIIGRSEIVGKPLAALLLQQNATITITHSQTRNLAAITKQADILIVAIGQANFINKKYLKKGVIIIDVGANYDSQGQMQGDVDALSVQQIAAMLSPVPGGVGPLTVASLFEQVVKAAEKRVKDGR
ncbi:bifunctional methylenetetrahydrofolate dehydrogenase/methenyltetrahydrofolate cyclohydrolase [Lactobacillus sp. W8089]|nr:bifunctional methylenetetrahydrofolate dehydrogenase/methenyltetrahydrofolate cyclohydrolase [Lactobacillus sp. W8086]MBI0109164.1 bifunctional methylenetetrahydrofolate dehydrogenase/methenyltetrahydrofolate cyclohydrolase [Lactobacillus sp. W8085]MBI0112451.1 bifunctional methylenetetrahydrofolate dehydrogenase/methenyltetrahydrofolate cyclohydrolase [Lactobacillus sp. W8088]MBI0116096.1 bifunctional methylenetetrahydrofolate dehydrogenase/methenyltetrahydrofolate cyclohydrolase [Lactobacil